MDRNLTKILAAKPVVDSVIEQLKSEVNAWVKRGVVPSLKVLLVGNHPPSLIYTKNKKKFIESLGAKCEIIHLDETISKVEFLKIANEISKDSDTHGCFAQLPLPKHLNDVDVANLFPANKDVDGFHPENIRAMVVGGVIAERALMPCTPKGIITLLKHYKFDLSGKNGVVIGRSMIVGKPMVMMLSNANASVSICHSKTKDISFFTKNAVLIVVAVGKKDFLTTKHLGDNKPWIIDVGQNVINDSLFGDVTEDCIDHCEALTPVPGGVGPMTICSLGQNLLAAVQLQLGDIS